VMDVDRYFVQLISFNLSGFCVVLVKDIEPRMICVWH
jgi:hypothetical protein